MENQIIYNSESVFDGPLKVNSCGIQHLSLKDYDTLRKNGRVDYTFLYIQKGRGSYEVNGETFSLEQGDLLIYPPKTRQHYSFKQIDDTTSFWSHFSGEYCDILGLKLGGEPTKIYFENSSHFESTFKRMITACNLKATHWKIACEGYQMVLLSIVANELASNAEKNYRLNNKGLETVLSRMYFHLHLPIDIDYYAKLCNVSRDRFAHIFTEKIGMPPYRYQLKLRIERAIDLLQNTDISVSECARVVGFENVSYFCRIFKKVTGNSPSFYKK